MSALVFVAAAHLRCSPYSSTCNCLQAKFAEDGSIQLHNFLKRSIADRILQQLVSATERHLD